MTLPRRFLPGQVKAVTRRTVDGKYLLTPTGPSLQIQKYALGLALARYPSVRVSAFCAMSNHTHCMLQDARTGDSQALDDPEDPEHSQVSDVFRDFHCLTARALNHLWGRGGALWSQGSFHDHDVFGQPKIVEELLYLWLNPVRAGLVERPEDYPGLLFLPEDIGKVVRVRRPRTGFFRGGLAQELHRAQEARAAAQALARRARAKAAREVAPGQPEPDPEPGPSYTQRHAELLWEEEQEARALLRDQRRAERDRARGLSSRRCKQLAQARARRRTKRSLRERAPEGDEHAARRSELPDEVSFTIHRPPGFDDLSDEELRLHLRALLDEALAALHAERAAEGRGYLGARQILRQDPEDRPPGSTRPTHARNPRVSCADRDRRLEELCRLEEYRHQRGATRHAWSQGNHQVVFPPGTYAHPRYHAARVGRAPPRPL
ncbi:MAG: transposase [Planctomycetota bacterium]